MLALMLDAPKLMLCSYYSDAAHMGFGAGSGPIYLDDVGCSGSELRLVNCSYSHDTADCTHSEDAGVRCQPMRKRQQCSSS